MIIKRAKRCTATHPETGLTFEVFCVDCFCEVFDTDGSTSFTFHERVYETATGQKVLPHKESIWIVQTDKNNWYVKENQE